MRLVEARIAEVVIGIYDPNPRIYRDGWRILRDGGVRLRDFPSDLRAEINADNRSFLDQFREAPRESGTATFDYTQNDGCYVLGVSNQLATRWSGKGRDSVYAVADRRSIYVAHARYAGELHEIDDPSAFDFSSHSVAVRKGEIAVFRNAQGDHALVRVEEVNGGEKWGADRYELQIAFEIRTKKEQ